VILVVGLAVVSGRGIGGYAAVRARATAPGAAGPGAGQAAHVRRRPPRFRSTSAGPWAGARLRDRVPAPRAGAAVMTRLGKLNENGYPTLVLVDFSIRDMGAKVWLPVWLAQRPNGSRGWVPRKASLPSTRSPRRIVIDFWSASSGVPPRGAQGDVPGGRGPGRGSPRPTGFFLREPEAQAAVGRRGLRRALLSAPARFSRSSPSGHRAGRSRSTAPTRTT